MGTVHVDGVRQVKRNGRIELEEYSYEKEFPGESRHSNFCEACGNERYPACVTECDTKAAKEYKA